MNNTINLSEARANKENDARLWTPLDCLKAIVRDLESGELRPIDIVYIAMARKGESGQAQSFPFYTAVAQRLELRGVLSQHLHDLCDDFNSSRS